MTKFCSSPLPLFFIVLTLLFYLSSVLATSTTVSSLSSDFTDGSDASHNNNSFSTAVPHTNNASFTPVETDIESTNSAAVTTSSLMTAADSTISQVAGITPQPAAVADASTHSSSHVTIVTEQRSSIVGVSNETQSSITSIVETLLPTAADVGSSLSADSSETGGTRTSHLTASSMLLTVPSSVVTSTSLVAETTAGLAPSLSSSTNQQNGSTAAFNSLWSTDTLLTTTMSPVNVSTVDMSTPALSTAAASMSVMSTTVTHTPLIIVSSPSDVTTTAVNTTTINVSWTVSNNSEYYIVTVNGDHACNTSHTSCVYGDLQPGCNYTVDVAACNNVNCSSTVSRTNNTFPAMPINLTYVTSTVNSLKVSWYQEGCASSYFIHVNDSLQVRHSTTNSSAFNIDELMGGALYCVAVSAKSGQLNGSKSSSTCYRTYPAAPTGLMLTARNETCVFLKWNQTGVIDNYNVSINVSSFTYQQSSAGTLYTGSVCMLEAGTLYVLQLSAVSGQLYSNLSSTLTISTVPEMPGEISVINRTLDSITLQWFQTFYASDFIVYASIDVVNVSATSVDGKAPGNITASFQNLTVPGGQYTIHVEAVSNAVNSLPRYLTTHTVPAAVSFVDCVNVTNSSFSVNVTVPDIGVKLSYQLKLDVVSLIQLYPFVYNKSHEQNKTFPVFFKNLAAGVTYSVSVTSVVADVYADPYVIECTTALNVVKSLKATDIVETSLLVSWSRPDGFLQQFTVNCLSLTGGTSQTYDIDGSQVQYTCSGLTPGAIYNVSVETRLNRTDVTPAVSPAQYAVTRPRTVEHVATSSVTNHTVVLQLKYPTDSQCNRFIVSTVPASVHSPFTVVRSNTSTMPVTLPDLLANTIYTVNITAQTICTFCNKPTRAVKAIEPDVKTAESTAYTVSVQTLPSAVSNFAVSETSATSTVLRWSSPDTDISLLTYYQVFVNKSGDNSCQRLIHILCNSSSSPVAAAGCNSHLSVDQLLTSCKSLSYTLEDLEASTDFIVTVFAANNAGSSVGTALPIQTKSVDKGWIAGVVIGVVVGVLLIIALGFFVWRRYRRRPRAMHKPSIGTDNPTFLGTGDISEPPCAVLIKDFVEHVDELHHDSDFRFSNEYELFKTLSPDLPKTVAELPSNRTKNRYTNILPFDHSRVKLIPLDDDEEGSDYINASYMPGYFSKREYIAAQGPMKCTLDDFWRMIWEQNISVVVMLTNLTERGREKCEQYWPEGTDPIYYGDVQVEVKSESTLGHYVIRVLEVRSDVKKRVVKQIHFSSWPDFGCPKDAGLLLEFIQCVRSHMSSSLVQGPLMVHCSYFNSRPVLTTFAQRDPVSDCNALYATRSRCNANLAPFPPRLDVPQYTCPQPEATGSVSRRVFVCQFVTWPDHGVPDDSDSVLDFVLEIRKNMKANSNSPVLVHCSAGVGRTGTYILIDRLLHAIQREDTIDLFGIILEMRGYRTNMIQTEAQYIFSHDCIRHAILRGMHLSNGPNGHANEEHVYVNSSECLYMNTNQVQAGGTELTTVKPSRSSEDINLLDFNE